MYIKFIKDLYLINKFIKDLYNGFIVDLYSGFIVYKSLINSCKLHKFLINPK